MARTLQLPNAVADEPTPSKRKLTRARKVPADPQPVTAPSRAELIARRAYALFEARGGTGGDALGDWLEAERQIDAETGSERGEHD
jgi:hypothetical protein